MATSGPSISLGPCTTASAPARAGCRRGETGHTLCHAHLLRNLEKVVEFEGEPDGWTAGMQRLLLPVRDTAWDWCDCIGRPVSEPSRESTTAAWDTLLNPVLVQCKGLPPLACGHRRGHNLILWTFRDDCLRFMADPAVPSQHNRVERDLCRVWGSHASPCAQSFIWPR